MAAAPAPRGAPPGVRRGAVTAVTAVPFAVATVAYAGVFMAHRDRLPGRFATHFSGDGTADGFMSRTAALWSATGLLVGLGLLFTALTVAARDKSGVRLTAAVGVGTAVTLGYLSVLTVLANADAPDAAAAELPLHQVAVPLLLGVATGASAWWLIGAGPRPAPAPPAPSLRLAEGEAAAWSRTVVSLPMLLVAAAVVLGGLCAVAFASWGTGLPLLAVGLLCVAFAGVRVTVDRRGLTVASTVLPRPRLTVPLDAVTGAESVQVDAMGDFGGWGYRIRPNRRGIVLRSGEALSVRTTGGRAYVVTVDDATTAAALLNGLVERQAGERG
ncbi:hypothetical protein GCM10018785_72330 [Streptomyces longispororuber]|uniref:DUF1648 domain-containing protein n=1 Tax=Streptomyces longispororuber TaxID=68230 RepID=A0A919E0F5_9ACTN|nr:DUF1648 domain-containing protein [Streptomyces longispororuber]GHE97338.1 hypothetical protein GCM10018785_72330 [Streptomyces longispororuber]